MFCILLNALRKRSTRDDLIPERKYIAVITFYWVLEEMHFLARRRKLISVLCLEAYSYAGLSPLHDVLSDKSEWNRGI